MGLPNRALVSKVVDWRTWMRSRWFRLNLDIEQVDLSDIRGVSSGPVSSVSRVMLY
jgi:hypothetical protein